jgi:hypothetical protein
MQARDLYTLNHDQIADLIAAVGKQRSVSIRGLTGTGKTTSVQRLIERPEFANHEVITVHCTLLDVGDVVMPMPNRERGCVEALPYELFAPACEKPCILILDENDPAKIPQPVIKALLPIEYDRMVGVRKLHPDTVVVGTRNLQEEGIGADFAAHESSRKVEVELKKPGNMEWVTWGINNGIHPAILGWVRDDAPPSGDDSDCGQLFKDFRDVPNPDDNPYIHHPQAVGRTNFVSPRTLHAASDILHAGLGVLDTKTLTAALIGTIGDYAAKQLQAFIDLAADLPTLEAIRNNPKTAKVPTGAAATCMVVYKALASIDATWVDQWMEYMERLDNSAQGLFVNGVRSEKFDRKSQIMNTKSFGSWCVSNQHLFTADKG